MSERLLKLLTWWNSYCPYWMCLFSPLSKLKECLDQRSDLKPVMITEAKALYDRYNKGGLTRSSSVDKRTLEKNNHKLWVVF